jgi:predicted DNA binding CopG/RHH family protein
MRRTNSKKKKDVKYGEIDDLTADDFRDENVKVRISMFVPVSLQKAYKEEALDLGIGYQTLMQMKLKEALENPIIKRLEKIEEKLKIG